MYILILTIFAHLKTQTYAHNNYYLYVSIKEDMQANLI